MAHNGEVLSDVNVLMAGFMFYGCSTDVFVESLSLYVDGYDDVLFVNVFLNDIF